MKITNQILGRGLASLLLAGGLSLTAIGAPKADAPLWLRNTAISPDGKTVAFTFKGDIFTVPVAGGKATQLTSSPAFDSYPVWIPDGKSIVFSSDRVGSLDLFVIPADGGTARRLTSHSGNETPLGFKDDKILIFSANIQPGQADLKNPVTAQTYIIDITKDQARPELFLSMPVKSLSFDKAGKMLYDDKKGYEDVFRKHERSSGTSDIWVVENGKFTKLTDFNGHDLNPLWIPGSDAFYFISEEDGTLNVYSRNLNGSDKKQLTKFTKHPVRSLSSSADGKTLAFSWNGEIYTLVPGQQPKKVAVNIVTDDYDYDLQKSTRRSGATDMAVSPSGDEIAFVMRGDVYVTSTKYKTTKRITDTPGQERNVSFSKDGRTLVYDSERDGVWQLFTATIKDKDEKQFAYATEIVEEPLYKCATSAQQPKFSPDGKKVAFLEDRVIIRVIDVKSKKVHTALPGEFNYSYADGDVSFDWSPDSNWLLADYIGVGGWNNTDIALVKADGSEVIDLTESGYSDGNAKWLLGGKAMAYSTGKYGMKSHGSWGNQNDVILMVLDPEAWDMVLMTEEEAALAEKAKKDDKSDKSDKSDKKDKKDKKDNKDKADEEKVEPLEFDLANRKYRMIRLTPMSGSIGDYYLDPKAEKFYYVAGATEGGYNLMSRDMKKGDVKMLVKGLSGGFIPSADGKTLYALTGRGMKKISLPSGSSEDIEFEAEYDRKPSLEREYIYDHAWKQVKDKFYDKNIHGIDWKGYGENYRRFLPYINNNYDFANLLSELLGELNASHTGGRYSAPGANLPTATLGAFFDPAYTGDGLKVKEVINGGPLSYKKVNVQPGDIIIAVDGHKIQAGKDYFPLLEGKAGKKVRLEVKKADGKTESVEVKPGYSERSLLYRRWVERNQAIVDSLSNGRIAYVHISGMDSPSFRTVYDQLLGKYRNREAVIVDTRWNGGGWLHNDVAQLLSGKEYVRFMPRGRYIGSEPFSQWTKPSVMLVNESNYSDAHGTPFVYQTLKIGDVVGAPVPGTMTAVWWETQVDPSLVFGIPQVTSVDMQGNVLENHQLNPDVVIYNNPADVMRGEDDQIKGAVNDLLKKLGPAKK